MVSVFAFYSNDPSSNPVYSFYVPKLFLETKTTKIKKKRQGLAYFKNWHQTKQYQCSSIKMEQICKQEIQKGP